MSPLAEGERPGGIRAAAVPGFDDWYAELRERFLRYLPDSSTFAEGPYVERERRYKDELIAMCRDQLGPLVEAREWRSLGNAAIALLTQKVPSLRRTQNIVDFRAIDPLDALPEEQREVLGRALGDLFDNQQPVPERLQAFSQQLSSLIAKPGKPHVGVVRVVSSFFLTLWDPRAFLFVKTRTIGRALRKLDPGFKWNPTGFTVAEVERLIGIWQRLFEQLEEDGWKPRDLIDVQGFLWVAMDYGTENAVREANSDEDEDGARGYETSSEEGAVSLNRVLYGPPGTGKTYHTVDKALEVLDPGYFNANVSDRPALKRRFDKLFETNRIRFVTFHQSFSYEDFVEGLRADTDGQHGALRYKVEDGVFKLLCEDARRAVAATPAGAQPERFVLIIDEINRGNVSRIFGELITLIEPSKRAGNAESLKVTLPYSKARFSVPGNVFLIGTMNTADRSLAGLDIALRRRFSFEEMAPRPELLANRIVEGIDLAKMLEAMNGRIELLLDREHKIGHAYFMQLKDGDALSDLASVFANQILPLLQEYFFDDWERIALVLNDHRKPEVHRFVVESRHSAKELFGPEADVQQDAKLWRLQREAFQQPESYRGIIAVHSE